MTTVAATLRQIAQRCQTLPRQFVVDAAKTIKTSTDKTLRDAAGADRSLRNAPRRLTVSTSVRGDTVVVGKVTPGKRGAAQWSWLESGTDPHRFGRGVHPGTAGKRVWTSGVEPALQALQRDLTRRFGDVMR